MIFLQINIALLSRIVSNLINQNNLAKPKLGNLQAIQKKNNVLFSRNVLSSYKISIVIKFLTVEKIKCKQKTYILKKCYLRVRIN